MKSLEGEGRHTTLVVADEALAEELRPTIDSQVLAVDHYLDALGEMAHRHVDAVVGRMDPMHQSLEPTVRALRELAPQARLLLVVDAEQEPQAMRAVRLGVDDYLVRPLHSDLVAAAIHGTKIAAPVLEEEAPAPPLSSERESEPAAASPAPPSAQVDVAPPQPAVDPSVPLADVHLVEQLLRERRGLIDLAIAAIRQRTGVADITYAPEPAPHQNAVPVRFESQQLGYLLSSVAGALDLAPHAAWLARWILLQRQIEQLQDLALRDPLTGVWNRRYFDRFLESILHRARAERFRVTVMLFDIDDFKTYNDRFGHAAGDEILAEAARLMSSVVRKQDIVARIGGDEFGVIFWDAEPKRRDHSEHPHSVRTAAQRFQRAICEHRFPKLAELAPDTLTISGGLASFPWDGNTAAQLVQLADECLLESKRNGKNAITFGPGAMQQCGMSHPREA